MINIWDLMIPANKNNLSISVIKFSIQKKKYSHNQYKPQTKTQCSPSPEKKQRQPSNMLRYSGLFPTTHIKVKSKKQRAQPQTYINPFSTSKYHYSRFPYRKPKTKRLANTTYFPIFREKISTTSVYESAKNRGSEDSLRPKARIASCFDLKHHEEEKSNFVRYSQKQLKTQYIERRHHTGDRFQQVDRLYVSP